MAIMRAPEPSRSYTHIFKLSNTTLSQGSMVIIHPLTIIGTYYGGTWTVGYPTSYNSATITSTDNGSDITITLNYTSNIGSMEEPKACFLPPPCLTNQAKLNWVSGGEE